ncbi:ATP-dependent DNA helicase DDX11 [Stomoxys calcitrans]|uniref:DNA 5'-3' helicase n=1 Tax=Stomoxys calcitrans TaxID=35570 RepID=A0A1I8P7P1_STOCA|nr:ATP-dependent DNA helicase DDX11 [Stomoxys calcitrans]
MYSPQKSLPTPSEFNFPFTPYDIQQQLMQELYGVLENKLIGIFESPTGTGKSLTLTCAALKWLEDHEALVRKELLERLERVSKEVEKLEKEQSVATDWISMHSQTSQQKQELLELKEVKKLLDEYEEKLSVIKEKRKLAKQNKLMAAKHSSQTNLDSRDVTMEEPNVLLEDLQNTDEDDEMDAEVMERNNKYRDIQIFFCSRTHTQLAQVVREIKRTAYGKRVRCVSMASRQQLCIHKELRKLNNTAFINERCLDMAKSTEAKTTSSDANRCVKKKARLNQKSLGKCHLKTQSLIQELSEISLTDVLDIEDLVKEGEQLEACPYYAARMATSMGQIVMLPYQLLLHKRSREMAGIDLQGSIVIIDEAHNLLDCISDIYSCEVTLLQLQSAQHQIVAYKMKYASRFSSANLLSINKLIFVIKRLIKLLTPKAAASHENEKSSNFRMLCTYEIMSEGDFFNIDLFQLLKFCEKSRLAQKLQGFAKSLTLESNCNENQPPAPLTGKSAALGLLKRLQQSHEEKVAKNSKLKRQPEEVEDLKSSTTEQDKKPLVNLTSSIRPLLAFLEALCEKAEDGRILVNTSENSASKYESQAGFKYILLNPGAHFQDVINEARAIVVAGGTMQPTSELTEQLFNTCPERVRQHFYDHVVPDDAVLPFVVTKGPSGRNLCFNFTQRSSTVMLNDLCSVLENLCNVVPAGLVCFVPSYDYLDSVYVQLTKTGIFERISNKKRIFREPRSDVGNAEQNVDQVLSDYSRAVRHQKGALLLSVVGAKLSEGLNFADDLGRGVIVVGLPYPYCNSPELKERMAYLDKTLGPGSGNEYYENLCMKAVNQCIGRSVRHIRDYACVYLLDERYARENIRRKLPQWISRHLQVAPAYGKVQAGTAKFFKEKKMKAAHVE